MTRHIVQTFEMVTVETCCCGCSLTTGTIVIGSLYIVQAVVQLLPAVIILATDNSLLIEGSKLSVGLDLFIIFTQLLLLVTSILLIIGVKCNWWKVMLAWIIAWVLYQTLMIIIYIIYVIQIAKEVKAEELIAALIASILGGVIEVILTAAGVYSCIVVYSLMDRIRHPHTEPEEIRRIVYVPPPPQQYQHQQQNQPES